MPPFPIRRAALALTLLTAVAVFGVSHLQAGAEPVAPADMVLVNGKIWTGEPYLPPGRKAVASKFASGAAILHGRFIVVGTDGDVRTLIGPHTQVIDLHGKMAMPGFNDAHAHFVQGASGINQVDLKDANSEAELVARIAAKAKMLKPGQWILGGSWDETRWPGSHLPTRQLIDKATPDNPVYVIRYDGHEALSNSVALKLAGIDKNSKDPIGGMILRDAKTGEPTGLVKDGAEDLVEHVIRSPTWEEYRQVFKDGLAQAAHDGVTSIQDMDIRHDGPTRDTADEMMMLRRAEKEGWLTARFYMITPLLEQKTLTAAGITQGIGDDMLRLGMLKEFADGSIGSRTAWFFDDYTDQPGYKGVPRPLMQPPSKMLEQVRQAVAANLQVAIHACGDRAISELLTIFETVSGADTPSRRFRIEHLQHVRPQDFARLGKLGVVASMQPYHAIDDGRFVDLRIGRGRSEYSYAWRSVLDAGAPLAFGTDWPIAPLNPLLGIYAAVTRETTDGKNPNGWSPDQKITLEEALRAYTQGSAYAEFQEGNKGTIAPGKLADIVVLSDDLFSISKEKIKDVTVLRTILGGKTVYEAGKL